MNFVFLFSQPPFMFTSVNWKHYSFCVKGDIKLKHRVVNDFIQLLNVSAENKIIFLKQQNWQSWLLALLVDSKYSERDTAILLSLIVNLMTMLFQHCIWQVELYDIEFRFL